MTKLNRGTKQSLSLTLKIQTRIYMRRYAGLFNEETDIDSLVEDIFFQWVRNSSTKDYIWTNDKVSFHYLQEHNEQLKSRIKRIVAKEIGDSFFQVDKPIKTNKHEQKCVTIPVK